MMPTLQSAQGDPVTAWRVARDTQMLRLVVQLRLSSGTFLLQLTYVFLFTADYIYIYVYISHLQGRTLNNTVLQYLEARATVA